MAERKDQTRVPLSAVAHFVFCYRYKLIIELLS